MKRSNVRHILIGAAAGVFCLCCLLYAGTQDIFLRPALESFVDESTGLEFPALLDSFQKVRVRKNLNPVFGTVVRYENEAGSCADVYIYSLDTGAKAVSQAMFEKHCRETDQDILNLPGQKPVQNLPSHKIQSSTHIEAPGRTAPPYGFEAYYRIQNGSMIMDSVLYLALCRGKLVKVRVSYSSEDEEEAKSAYRFIDAVAAMVTPKSAESRKPAPAPSKTDSARTAKTPEAEAVTAPDA